MIELDKLPEHLTTIKQSDWKKLFDLLDEIKATDKFGEVKGMEKLTNGSITFSYWFSFEVVDKFLRIVRELDITPDFEWTKWEKGRTILKNNKQDYEQFDIITLCKFLTTIIRAGRFSDGYLVSCFKNGIISKIILSIKNKVKHDG